MEDFNPISRINELCQERRWSLYQLAKASEIPYSTLNTMINKANMPTIATLKKLCLGFGISMAEFFEPDQNFSGLTDDQIKCLSLWNRMTVRDKELVIAYMKGRMGET